MILFKKAKDLYSYISEQRKEGKKIGFVPTMGALHKGHISLLERSKKENGLTVCSIFVNPTQFNDPKDFEKYPVTIEKDILLLEGAGCDVLFFPPVKEMYPEGPKLEKEYELGFIETILEGKFRPGHFQGVCMIVHRLLDIVIPDNLYMGQKDYQQCMVIQKMLSLTGLGEKIKLQVSPTLREKEGLAMSSRNERLSEKEKKLATSIFQALVFIKDHLKEGDLISLKQKAAAGLIQKGFKPDYVEIADAATLEPVDNWDGRQKMVALVAAFLNEVRLIDNMVL